MKDIAWMEEVLQDMAAFAIENDLPKTYDALNKAMVATTTETQHKRLPQMFADNVIPMFQRTNDEASLP